MPILEPGYLKWVSDRMWDKGLHLFADSDSKQEIEKIAFLISRSKEITITKRKYKGTEVFLLYQEKNQFPIVPSMYYYQTIEPADSEWLYLSDTINASRNCLAEVF